MHVWSVTLNETSEIKESSSDGKPLSTFLLVGNTLVTAAATSRAPFMYIIISEI